MHACTANSSQDCGVYEKGWHGQFIKMACIKPCEAGVLVVNQAWWGLFNAYLSREKTYGYD